MKYKKFVGFFVFFLSEVFNGVERSCELNDLSSNSFCQHIMWIQMSLAHSGLLEMII